MGQAGNITFDQLDASLQQMILQGVAAKSSSGSGGGGGGGTVTSVGLTVPGELSVAGSPVTSSGVLAVSKVNQSANQVYAGPTTGSAAAPTFRLVDPADLPVATTSALGAVKPDGSTILISGGVISAPGGAAGSVVMISSQSFSGVSNVNLPSVFTSAYDEYEIYFHASQSTTSTIQLQATTNNGSTYDSSSSYVYSFGWTGADFPTSVGAAGNTASAGDLWFSAAPVANIRYDARITVFDPLSAFYKAFVYRGNFPANTNGDQQFSSLMYKSTTALTGVRFHVTAGTITGKVYVYGFKNT